MAPVKPSVEAIVSNLHQLLHESNVPLGDKDVHEALAHILVSAVVRSGGEKAPLLLSVSQIYDRWRR